MAKHKVRKPPARALCDHFTGTILVGCARAGLGALEAEHKSLITAGPQTACGVDLDRCRKSHEPESNRWDYVFTFRQDDRGVAVEVHQARPSDVDEMIAKKNWAKNLLDTACPNLKIAAWIWVASGEILMLRQEPLARKLVDAGISFPTAKCDLP